MAKKDTKRTGDAAGVGPYAREREGLAPLGDMRGWNVVKGETDIRGWDIRTVSGKVLGTVRELMVDPDAGEVVMLDVDLAGTDRHALVPIRVVEIDRGHRVVRADSSDLQAQSADEQERTVRDYGTPGEVRYANGTAERVLERRPIVEETVVRRRDLEDPDARP